MRWRDLAQLNPGLIVAPVTPFRLASPLRKYSGDDLIAVASDGVAYATPGLPNMVNLPEEEPPQRANTSIGEYLAGLQAAIATMLDLEQRDRANQGCEVDVSQQEAVARVMSYDIAYVSYKPHTVNLNG